MKVLTVPTSHEELGNTGKKTGFWLEELAAPYYRFKDAGAESRRRRDSPFIPRRSALRTGPALQFTWVRAVGFRPHHSPPASAGLWSQRR
ncbi:hypothetical protein [Actinacidiphila acididurans]|uniref:hypothetical protein n=1 Tax=Actinacidiphila acididurans TaxID=2784346 RepID=UPI001F458498|nr:hypothetical protein [Actinacidiphila acididurans]